MKMIATFTRYNSKLSSFKKEGEIRTNAYDKRIHTEHPV